MGDIKWQHYMWGHAPTGPSTPLFGGTPRLHAENKMTPLPVAAVRLEQGSSPKQPARCIIRVLRPAEARRVSAVYTRTDAAPWECSQCSQDVATSSQIQIDTASEVNAPNLCHGGLAI